jgi:nucleotide-binding universal stress UspA family protein
MLRSMLVALDGSDSSVVAARHAFGLARRLDAHVEGLGIVNSTWILRPEPVPLGAMATKVEIDAQQLTRAEDRMEVVLQHFRNEARDAGMTSVAADWAEGNPVDLIEQEATAHDLVLLGRDSMFDVEGELHELPSCVERIIRREPRPILLVPTECKFGDPDDPDSTVLLAFDGSAAASRTLHTFSLLGLAERRMVHVVTLDNDSSEVAQSTAERACKLLRRHRAANTRAIGLGDKEAGSASETILGLAKSLGVGMIVMGAYGRSGIREIFGSCTWAVLNACPTALFLHR